jgi:hypothetical protein
MSAVHTQSAAIFNGLFVNEAEEKIQFVKIRPSQPYDGKSPVHFTIPANTSQYTSLADSYLFVRVHVEETDEFGNPLSAEEGEAARRKRRKRSTTNEPTSSSAAEEEETIVTGDRVNQLLEDAELRWMRSQKAYAEAREESDPAAKERKNAQAKTLADLADRSFKTYLQARSAYRKNSGESSYLIPIDNVMHSMWNNIDVLMNGELVSTTNQKYAYKAYIETVLNNSHSTKKYQLKTSGYYGDNGDRDINFVQNWNKGMENRCVDFRRGKPVEMRGFLLSDILGVKAAIVNGVEINIVLTPNTDNLRLQTFENGHYGRLVIEDIYMNVCKRQMAKEVVVAHAELMESEEATYPFKKTDLRTYNGNKGSTEIVIENPYESKIPTRLIVAMIDAVAYIGDWKLNPLNFKHYDISRAAFLINDENIAKPPYNLDIAGGKYIEPFMELYSILGKAGEDTDIGISRENYLNGMFLLPFDVTPTSAANMEYLSKKEGGNCRLELQFRKPLPNNIIVLTYAIFPNELRIDGVRNCRVVPV